MARTKWTEEEDKIVLEFISKHPENIREACELASKKLTNKTDKAISVRYYRTLKNRPTNKSFFLISKKRATLNQKNVAKGNKAEKSQSVFKSKWKRILAILAE